MRSASTAHFRSIARRWAAAVVPIAVIASWIAARAAVAQPPADGEFRINTRTAGYQERPEVVARRDGSFVVVWAGLAGVSGQRFDAEGRPVGSEIDLAAGWSPAVAASDAGDLVVAWNESAVYPNAKVMLRRLESDGEPRGSAFVVTETDYGGHDLAMSPSGAFGVTWADWGGAINLHAFDATGVRATDDPVQVDGPGGGEPAIAAGAEEMVVVWGSPAPVGGQILGQRFSSAGERLGPSFQVSTDTTRSAWNPDVAMSPDGAFVVVWNQDSLAEDVVGVAREVAGQRFNSDGSRVGARFRVDADNLGRQFEPAVAMGGAGDFFVVWGSTSLDWSEERLFGQLFDPSGARVGSEIPISVGAVGVDPRPAVAMAPNGTRLTVWQRQATARNGDVFGRFLFATSSEDADGDGIPDARDNCPTVANEDQADAQADGYGDECVSPDVVLPPDLGLGANPIIDVGTTIGARVAIGDDATIGEHVAVGVGVRAGDDLQLDDFSVIGPRTVLGSRVVVGVAARTDVAVTIENDVTIGEHAVLKRNVTIDGEAVIEPYVVVFAGAIVGRGAVVETGARIGRRATVRAGAVVPAGTTVPAGAVFP